MQDSNVGAPIGNDNRWRASVVQGSIRRALAENQAKGRESLVAIAHKLIEDAEAGNIQAVNTLYDRLDGKAVAKSEVSGPDGSPVQARVELAFVEPDQSSGEG